MSGVSVKFGPVPKEQPEFLANEREFVPSEFRAAVFFSATFLFGKRKVANNSLLLKKAEDIMLKKAENANYNLPNSSKITSLSFQGIL